MNQEEAQRIMAEFNGRLRQLVEKNPRLTPESPEIIALIKEFNNRGIPIQIVRPEDLMRSMMGMVEMLSQMGMSMPNENIYSSRDTETLEQNLKPCKYHKKGLDDVNRSSEISKREVDDFSIDINTLTDEQIWNKYFGGKKG